MGGSSDARTALRKVTAALPAGEERDGQLAMAEAVERALAEKRHLLVQAGTGTGKSLAYLVPALLSGRRVVVATVTKALQDQLAKKDLPFLAEALDEPFTFAVLKGRSNYLCLQKLSELSESGQQLQLEATAAGGEGADDLDGFGQELLRVVESVRRSETGDRAELPFEPSPRVWGALSVGREECPGASRCPMGESCYAEAARERAADADVVVVNTHLYGVHVASAGTVLPEHDVVVLDEAHALEEVATATLGIELSAGRFRALARALRAILTDAADFLDGVERAGTSLETALVPHRDQRVLLTKAEGIADALAGASDQVAKAMAAVRQVDVSDDTAAGAKRTRAVKAAGALADDVATAIVGAADEDDARVAWVEGPPNAPVLRLAPIDVGPVLANRLWNGVTAILTSATIPPGLGTRLGMEPDAFELLDVGSPFDYERNALLYCAAHLPDPRHPDHQVALHAELEALIRAAGGRTLALFTSWRAMRAAADALADRLPYRVLTQTDLPKPALLAAFTGDETSVLFATMGFWQGVDVPGRALSLVTIDRIPFPRPDEPLTQARRERAGPAAFATVDVPRAATLLAQGAGRLVRTATDRGVVAVLDPRLAKASYRWALVNALPPMRRTKDRREVERFLGSVTV